MVVSGVFPESSTRSTGLPRLFVYRRGAQKNCKFFQQLLRAVQVEARVPLGPKANTANIFSSEVELLALLKFLDLSVPALVLLIIEACAGDKISEVRQSLRI